MFSSSRGMSKLRHQIGWGRGVTLLFFCLLLCVSFFSPNSSAQSSSTGLVTGTVTDPTGAVVPNATVTIQQAGTNATQVQTTDASGRFVFASVPPGDYTMKVVAKGFRTAVINKLDVEVAKSRTVDVKLELGETSEVIEVMASTMTELQTTDATVGETLSGTELSRMPVLGRSAAALVFLQPSVAPDVSNAPTGNGGGGDTGGGAIAGARSEQVTFTIDGGDATSDLEGSNSYVSPSRESSAVSPVVPVPIDSTQEFRVSTSNPNSLFGRSSGGQISILTKEGTNVIHGAAYEYHEDDGLDANGWTNNFNGIHKPHLVDNRFGGDVGGPIIKNKFFYYGFYEGRRFHDNATISRVVPTDTLKQGILRFRDASGNIVSYNLNPANGALTSACGSSGNSACDPRGIGISPVIASQLALYPTGANTTLGDGLNTIGLVANVATPIRTDVGKLKLSYNFNNKWSMFATFQYAKTDRTGTEQVNILGTPKPASGDPYYSTFYTFQVTGQLTSNLVSTTHGSFLRNWWAWARTAPQTFVSGTDAPLQLTGEGVGGTNTLGKLLADPVNINTQQARARIWDGHDWYIAQDMSWTKSSHTVQFGGAGYIWHDYHLRTDDVLGGLTSAPIYYIGARGGSQMSNAQITSAFRPPTCGGSVTTNCIQSGDVSRWNSLFATVLGLVDHSSQIQTRDGNFNPNPLGTPLFDKTTIPSFTTYLQDVWKLRPSLTLTVGLDWGVQLAPSEEAGKEVVLTYADTNTPVNYREYLQSRAQQLAKGNIFNPSFGLIPVNHLTGPLQGKMRVTDWTDLSPRIAVAWQVPFQNKLFGNNQTVIRAGYAKVFDRTSAVNEVLSPLLTGGLADVDKCAGPTSAATTGAFTCSGLRTDPSSAYRIGVDGTGPGVPAPTSQNIPYIPGAPFGLFLSAPLDPYVTPGYSHSITFSVQRALAHNLFLELGYIGRFSRNLPQGESLTSPYYLMKDAKSGQTYAQAFDAVAQQLRAGVDPSLVTPQPFFENLIGPGGTVLAASDDASDLINGDLNSFGTFEVNFDTPQFLDNMQVFEFAGVTDGGYSNYNAGYLVFRKAMSSGLQFQYDWTWSHAIGNQGINQQYLYSSNSPYNFNIDRSSELFDHRHVMHFSWYYELPFGKGKRFASSGGALNQIVGGWHTAGIFTYFSGAPLCIGADGNYGSFFNFDCAIPSKRLGGFSPHSGVPGSGGIATTGDPAVGGSGLNAFRDPATVFNNLSHPLLSQFGRVPFDQLNAFPYWNIDLSVGKNFAFTERYHLVFTMDAVNILNHVVFATPSLDLGSPTNFGVINAQANQPRAIQLGLRFEF